MRIAYVTHYSALYGANRSLLALIDGLVPRGHDVAVLTLEKGPLLDELCRRDVASRVLPFERWMATSRIKAPFRALSNLAALPGVIRWLADRDVELIHTNSSVVPVGAYAAMALGVPHVWHVREFGRDDYGLRYDFGRAFFRFWLDRADAVVAVSRAVADEVLDGVDAPSRVVYNAVIHRDAAEALRRESRASDEGGAPYTFAIVGMLHPTKGQDEAIRALAGISEPDRGVRLLVAGEGDPEYERRLRGVTRDLDLEESVRFLGFVEDPFRVYRSSDAVLVCSRREAMGRATAEAMAAGLPVIGRDSGATPELVDDGRTGLLYGGGADELALKMERLASSPEWGRRLGKEAWSVAVREFVVERHARQIQDIYRSVL